MMMMITQVGLMQPVCHVMMIMMMMMMMMLLFISIFWRHDRTKIKVGSSSNRIQRSKPSAEAISFDPDPELGHYRRV